MSSRCRKIIRILLPILWMIIIFWFSNQPGQISDEKSKFVIKVLQYLNIDVNSFFGDLANFAVRKTGHFMEYLILFVLYYNAVYHKVNYKKAILYSIAMVFIYACTDEFHQLFIEGRSGKFKDVLIDTSGAIFGGAIVWIKETIKVKRKS